MAKATLTIRVPAAGARKTRTGAVVAPRTCPTPQNARASALPATPMGGTTCRRSGGLKREHSPVRETVPRQVRARMESCERPALKLEARFCAVKAPVSLEVPVRDLQAVVPAEPYRDLKAIVINLERRPDRMEGCANRLNTHCPWLSFSRFTATDGKATRISESEVATSWHTARNVVYQRQRAVRKGWNDLETYQERTLALSPGERGCAMSHIRAWRRCLELAGDSNRPLLVLEDDAAPTAEFTALLRRALTALPGDAGLLYLGYSQAADWRRELTPELAEAEYVWTTVGYIVWPNCARKMLSRLPVNEPVDNWMAGLCATGDLKAYCVRPKIVLQADAWNVNSDVAHSDEHYWGPNSDIQHSDHLYWGPEHPEAREAQPLALTGGATSFFALDSDDSEDDADAI